MKVLDFFAVLLLCASFGLIQGWKITQTRVLKSNNEVLHRTSGFRLPSTPKHVSELPSHSPDSFIPTSIIPHAFTGPGCVLLTQPNESDHFLMNSALLVFSHSDKFGTQAVMLDRTSAFRMGDSLKVAGPFDGNPLFLGGNVGSETAVMLHRRPLQTAKPLGYGLYLGGMGVATELIDSMRAAPMEFKFVFNYVYWRPGELQKELDARRWDVCLMPPELVLTQKYIRLWSKARKELRPTGFLHDMSDEESSSS